MPRPSSRLGRVSRGQCRRPTSAPAHPGSVPAVGGVVLAAARRIVGLWCFTYLKSLRKIHRRRASALTPTDDRRGGLEHAVTGSTKKGTNS